MSERRGYLAYCLPFFIFLGFLALVQVLEILGSALGLEWLRLAKYWLYPVQSLVCAGALIFYWKEYEWGRRVIGLGVLAGGVALGIWVAPEAVFGMPKRLEGFNPEIFADDRLIYWGVVVSRFFRLVVVVPIVEEVFWRGFLQRYLISGTFRKVGIGEYSHFSFCGVAIAFMLAHSTADWVAAFLTAILFGWVVVLTRSLVTVVVAHAVTNLGLGFYIMATKQWGYW